MVRQSRRLQGQGPGHAALVHPYAGAGANVWVNPNIAGLQANFNAAAQHAALNVPAGAVGLGAVVPGLLPQPHFLAAGLPVLQPLPHLHVAAAVAHNVPAVVAQQAPLIQPLQQQHQQVQQLPQLVQPLVQPGLQQQPHVQVQQQQPLYQQQQPQVQPQVQQVLFQQPNQLQYQQQFPQPQAPAQFQPQVPLQAGQGTVFTLGTERLTSADIG